MEGHAARPSDKIIVVACEGVAEAAAQLVVDEVRGAGQGVAIRPG